MLTHEQMVENLKSAIKDLQGLMLPYPAIHAAKLKMEWVLEALEFKNPLRGYPCPACGRRPEQSENVTDRVNLPRKS